MLQGDMVYNINLIWADAHEFLIAHLNAAQIITSSGFRVVGATPSPQLLQGDGVVIGPPCITYVAATHDGISLNLRGLCLIKKLQA